MLENKSSSFFVIQIPLRRGRKWGLESKSKDDHVGTCPFVTPNLSFLTLLWRWRFRASGNSCFAAKNLLQRWAITVALVPICSKLFPRRGYRLRLRTVGVEASGSHNIYPSPLAHKAAEFHITLTLIIISEYSRCFLLKAMRWSIDTMPKNYGSSHGAGMPFEYERQRQTPCRSKTGLCRNL